MGGTGPVESSSGAGRAASPLRGGARREGAPRARTLRVRFVLIVAAVCAAVWLSTLFDTVRDREATLSLAERQNDNVANALAEQAARALQATDLILKQAAMLDPDIPGAATPREAVPDLLRRHMSGVPQVRNLFLFDPARQLHLSSAPAGSANMDLSDRSYFLSQRDQPDRGLFVSEPFISRVNGDPTFVLSRRLYDALDLGGGSTIELLRADGTALVSADGRLQPGPSPWLAAVQRLGA